MNDDAKFFFCLCGFVGFVAFFTSASFIHSDASIALLYGSFGCLGFAVFGRFLLGIMLRGYNLGSDPKDRTGKSVKLPARTTTRNLAEEKKQEALAAMNDAATKAAPKVKATA